MDSIQKTIIVHLLLSNSNERERNPPVDDDSLHCFNWDFLSFFVRFFSHSLGHLFGCRRRLPLWPTGSFPPFSPAEGRPASTQLARRNRSIFPRDSSSFSLRLGGGIARRDLGGADDPDSFAADRFGADRLPGKSGRSLGRQRQLLPLIKGLICRCRLGFSRAELEAGKTASRNTVHYLISWPAKSLYHSQVSQSSQGSLLLLPVPKTAAAGCAKPSPLRPPRGGAAPLRRA